MAALHRSTMLKVAFATVLMLAGLFGCSAAPGDRSAGPLAPSTKPSSSAPSGEQRELPAVYAAYGDPAPVTPEQTRWIQDSASRATPSGRSVWFVLILDNDPSDLGVLSARVFYTPDSSTARLRKGSYINVRRVQGRSFQSERLHYCQVSAANKPFDGSTTVPPVTLLPFATPTDQTGTVLFDDTELVQLVDAVRHALDSDRSSPDSCKRDPIWRIEPFEGAFDVYIGWETGPLSGGGCILSMKRTAAGFRKSSSGMWAS